MCTILFLFIRERQKTIEHDWLFELVKRYVCWAVRKPKPLLAVVLFCSHRPEHHRIFAADPPPFRCEHAVARTETEPRQPGARHHHGQDARALGTCAGHHSGEKCAGPERSVAQDRAALERLQRDGKIKGYSTPAALALSPKTMAENRATLTSINFDEVADELRKALDEEGFSRGPFASAFHLLDELKNMQDPATPMPHWRDHLPRSSSWWFLIDRYFARDPLLTTGFVTTNEPIVKHATYETLSARNCRSQACRWFFPAGVIPWPIFCPGRGINCS